MRINIDGTSIRTADDLHDALAGPLDFGPYYGRNLNALWDRLTTDVERPVELVWGHSAASREMLGEELFARIQKLLIDVMKEDERAPADKRFVVRFE